MTLPYEGVESGSLRGIPGNDAVLDELGRNAEPASGESPYSIDAYVLHTHPDLCDRLLALADGVGGVTAVGVYGIPCLIDGDRAIRVFARGTSSLWLSAPAASRAALGPDESWPAPELGPSWIRLDAWQTVRPSNVGTAWLRALVSAAFDPRDA